MSSFTSNHGWAFLEIDDMTWKFQLKHNDVSAELIFSSGGAYRSGSKIHSLDHRVVLELQESGTLLLSEHGRLVINIRLPVLSYNTLKSYIESLPEIYRTNVLHVYDYVLVGRG